MKPLRSNTTALTPVPTSLSPIALPTIRARSFLALPATWTLTVASSSLAAASTRPVVSSIACAEPGRSRAARLVVEARADRVVRVEPGVAACGDGVLDGGRVAERRDGLRRLALGLLADAVELEGLGDPLRDTGDHVARERTHEA